MNYSSHHLHHIVGVLLYGKSINIFNIYLKYILLILQAYKNYINNYIGFLMKLPQYYIIH